MKKFFTAFASVAMAGMSVVAAPVSYAPLVSMHTPPVSNEIIEDAPEGELSWLDRTCDGFVTKAFEATHGMIRGSIVQRVDGVDGYVYLSHMASEYPVNTWTRFEKQGDTLVMEGVQAIYEEYDDWYEEYFTVYLAPMQVVIDENNVGTFVVNDDCRYVLNIGGDGSLTSADPSMILGVCVHTVNEDLTGNDVWIWKGFGDRDVKMVPQTSVPVSLPEGLEVADWVMSDRYVKEFVQVAVDGNDFYVCGLDRSLPEAWVKGTISDGKVTFPSGQYLGADMEIYYYSYFCGAEFSDATDEDGETYRECAYEDKVVFDYDAVNGILTSGPGKGYIINSTAKELYPLYFYEDVTVAVQQRNPETVPEAPYDIEFFYDDWGSSVWFQIPNKDVEDNVLMTDRLYYEVYVDGKLQYFDIYDENGNVENTSRIPYSYDDWDLFWVAGADHTVYLDVDGEEVKGVGIRSIYLNENGEDIYSAMAFWGDSSAVDGINKQGVPVSVKWYDLQGRPLSGNVFGIAIKVATYSDGTVVSEKVVSTE